MARRTQAERVRHRIRQLNAQIARSESDIARAKKKARSAEAHGKYLLGLLADLAGWETRSIEQAEVRIRHVAAVITASSDVSAFRECGDTIFNRHKLAKPGSTVDSTTLPFPSGARSSSDIQIEAERKALIHYRITLGGLWVKYGMGAERKSVILGAMVLVEDPTGW